MRNVPRLTVLLAGLVFSCIAQTNSSQNQASDPLKDDPWKDLRRDAEAGSALAQGAMGANYETGYLVPQDYVEAAKWYRKAAMQGEAEAQFRMGALYRLGHGVPQDYVEAVKWSRKAALQGHSMGQSQLAYLYNAGLGTERNQVEAAKWYGKAAVQGNALAQGAVGSMYLLGMGVPQDYVLAHMWLNLAAAASSGEEQERYGKFRDTAASVMTPQQVAEAQRLAREWKPVKSKVEAMYEEMIKLAK